MSKNKWLYDASTNSYHNTDCFISMSIDEVTSFDGETLYEIEALRIDGKFIQISDRVNDPRILHKMIAEATGGK